MGPIGVQEMIAIFVIALLLFGPRKLPELARMIGKALSEFRRAKNELKASLETHLNELERETRISSSTHDYTSVRYPHPYEDYGSRSIDYSSSNSNEPQSLESSAHVPDALPPAQEPADDSAKLASPQGAPVAGTVPRSNGIYSADAVPASTEQDRSL
jgi:TatA/E family protein of Tat protein translocase